MEIEEKADADYTGLKIQSLRLEEREAAAAKEEEEEEEAAKNGGAVNDGPWKKVEAAPVIEKETTEVVSESKEASLRSDGVCGKMGVERLLGKGVSGKWGWEWSGWVLME